MVTLAVIASAFCYFHGQSSSLACTASVFDVPPDFHRDTALLHHVIKLGSGQGNDLFIDGMNMTINEHTVIRITAGTYRSVAISNIFGIPGSPVRIINDGLVEIKDGLHTTNIRHVTLSGNGHSGTRHGIRFKDIPYRAITMQGRIDGVTIEHMSFENVGDFAISGSPSNGDGLSYDGTEATCNKGFKILNCSFENTGGISFGGNLNGENNEDNGLFKDVEIAYNRFTDSDPGSVCSFTNVKDYRIHHNTVDNVNNKLKNHNGVFFMQGNGHFHHNKLTNYQGNAIRIWAYSRGQLPDTVKIHHNICYNSRQYGAFEIQGFSRNLVPGKSTNVHAQVYNNTVGKMDTEQSWEGVILDLYNYWGKLSYHNNLGFELHGSRISPHMINNMSDVEIEKITNNKYFASEAEAIHDNRDFASRFKGIGAR